VRLRAGGPSPPVFDPYDPDTWPAAYSLDGNITVQDLAPSRIVAGPASGANIFQFSNVDFGSTVGVLRQVNGAGALTAVGANIWYNGTPADDFAARIAGIQKVGAITDVTFGSAGNCIAAGVLQAMPTAWFGISGVVSRTMIHSSSSVVETRKVFAFAEIRRVSTDTVLAGFTVEFTWQQT
jgi:hypothetical protein